MICQAQYAAPDGIIFFGPLEDTPFLAIEEAERQSRAFGYDQVRILDVIDIETGEDVGPFSGAADWLEVTD